MKISKKICLIALTWDYFGHAWKHAHRQTLNIIVDLPAVRYKSEPIIPWYLVKSTFVSFSSISSFIDVSMGVSAFLTCYIPNLFSNSLMYLLWLKKMSSFVCFICNSRKKFNSPSCSFQTHLACILQISYKEMY
jgi:hypothetical protein